MARDLLVNGEILLFGDVGDPWGWGDGFTPGDVATALAIHGDGDVSVRVNSGGGIAVDGMAIHSLLKAHPGKVRIAVDGIAASAASLIAMAGDTIDMRDGAIMMIHDPAALAVGTAAELAKAAAALDKLADNYAGVYARRADMKREQAREIMRSETWLNADDAIEQGFATGKLAESADAIAKFDFRIYAHAPSNLPVRRREAKAMAAAVAFARSNLAAVTKAPAAPAAELAAAAASSGGQMTEAEKAAAAAQATADATAAAPAAATAAAPAAAASPAAATAAAPVADADASGRDKGIMAERERTAEIATLAIKHGLGEAFASEHISKGTALDAVRKIVLDAKAATVNPATPRTPPQGAGTGPGAASAAWDKVFTKLGALAAGK